MYAIWAQSNVSIDPPRPWTTPNSWFTTMFFKHKNLIEVMSIEIEDDLHLEQSSKPKKSMKGPWRDILEARLSKKTEIKWSCSFNSESFAYTSRKTRRKRRQRIFLDWCLGGCSIQSIRSDATYWKAHSTPNLQARLGYSCKQKHHL